jgi:hypothetical protein
MQGQGASSGAATQGEELINLFKKNKERINLADF